jgi:hypothetical protein
MSRLILKPIKPVINTAPPIPKEVEAVLFRVLAEEIRTAVNRQPPPPARPVANTTPPAWAVALTKRIEETSQKLNELTALQKASEQRARQPMVEFITANSDIYTADDLGKMGQADLERVHRLVLRAVGPRRGIMNVAAARGLIAKPQSLIEAIQARK